MEVGDKVEFKSPLTGFGELVHITEAKDHIPAMYPQISREAHRGRVFVFSHKNSRTLYTESGHVTIPASKVDKFVRVIR